MKRTVINIGDQFGRLTVVGEGLPTKNGSRKWDCVCICGGVNSVISAALNSGKTTSCGCIYRESRPFTNRKHGESRKTTEYKTWAHIQDRCYNPNNKKYYRYGLRGIIVCERWLGENGYENFLSDMGRKPTSKHSLDRIDNNGNYEPSNCRWATSEQQSRNRSNNVWIEYLGERKVLQQWADELKVTGTAIQYQINRKGIVEAIEHFKNKLIHA